MNDEKQPNADSTKPDRTPNREYQRMPRVIEGEAFATAPVAASGDKPDTASASLAPPEATPADGDKSLSPQSGLGNATSSQPSSREARGSDSPDIGATGAGGDKTASAAPHDPPAPFAPPAEARGYGLGALAAASLGSAALAALAVFGLQTISAPAGPSPALEARIADVERQTAAIGKNQGPSPAAIAALEKRIASVETVATGAADTARKAVDTVAARPDVGQSGSAPAQQALSALGDRLARFEKAITTAPDLDARVVAIEKTLAAPKTNERATETRVEAAPPPDLDPLRKQTAALEGRLQALERQTAPLAEAARAAEARLNGVEASVQPLAGQLEDARARNDAERKRAEALAARSAGAAQIALAQSITAAIASGAPFAPQVEALGRLGLPAEKLAPLLASAKTGVATNAELARTLAALESKIVARPEVSSDASIMDRLATSALGLVRVKPAGEATGASPADVFARMTRAMLAGDLTLAIKEWEALPDKTKADSADWAKRVRERLAAEGAARALLAEQAQTLGRS